MKTYLKIVGIDRHLVQNKNIHIGEGILNLRINTSIIPNGLYVLVITSGTEVLSEKIIIR